MGERLGAAGSLCRLCLPHRSATVVAQTFPSRPITLIVPFPPGGPADIGARAADAACERDHRTTGAGRKPQRRRGQVGCDGGEDSSSPTVTRFILQISERMRSTRHCTQKLSYDPDEGLHARISLMYSLTHVLVVNPEGPIKSVSDLVKQAKDQPGKLSFRFAGRR